MPYAHTVLVGHPRAREKVTGPLRRHISKLVIVVETALVVKDSPATTLCVFGRSTCFLSTRTGQQFVSERADESVETAIRRFVLSKQGQNCVFGVVQS